VRACADDLSESIEEEYRIAARTGLGTIRMQSVGKGLYWARCMRIFRSVTTTKHCRQVSTASTLKMPCMRSIRWRRDGFDRRLVCPWGKTPHVGEVEVLGNQESFPSAFRYIRLRVDSRLIQQILCNPVRM
jgi:hypothetical protein